MHRAEPQERGISFARQWRMAAQRLLVAVLALLLAFAACVRAESDVDAGSDALGPEDASPFRWWKVAVIAVLSLAALGIAVALLGAAWYKQLKKDREDLVLEAIINDWDESDFSEWVNM